MYKVPQTMKDEAKLGCIKHSATIPDFDALTERQWHALVRKWANPRKKDPFAKLKKDSKNI